MAQILQRRITLEPELELVASGPLSIVRFRYVPDALRDQPEQLDRLNKSLAAELQRRGKAFLTSTHFQGKEALRACIVNYMTTEADIRVIVNETLLVGRTLSAASPAHQPL